MKRKWTWVLSLALVMVFVLAACGNSDKKSDNGGSDNNKKSSDTSQATTLNVTATNWKFNKDTFNVPANKKITINFESKEGSHGFDIEGTDINIKDKGKETITFKPGTYKVHCSIPCGQGHQDMLAKIVAK